MITDPTLEPRPPNHDLTTQLPRWKQWGLKWYYYSNVEGRRGGEGLRHFALGCHAQKNAEKTGTT